MPLEVIGAGFGRTGTACLQEALEILLEKENKHCYHFFSMIHRWTQPLRGKVDPEDVD
jgi:hypothetical protein